MEKEIVVNYGWNISQGDYKRDELSYIKQRAMVKQEKKRETAGAIIALGVIAFAVLFLFMTFASRIKI